VREFVRQDRAELFGGETGDQGDRQQNHGAQPPTTTGESRRACASNRMGPRSPSVLERFRRSS
jgi:hypothetical protein